MTEQEELGKQNSVIVKNSQQFQLGPVSEDIYECQKTQVKDVLVLRTSAVEEETDPGERAGVRTIENPIPPLKQSNPKRKQNNYAGQIEAMGDYDWSNINFNAGCYPKVAFMTPIVFQFWAASQYFPRGISVVETKAKIGQLIRKNQFPILLNESDKEDLNGVTLVNKAGYDYWNDMFIQEMKHFEVQDLWSLETLLINEEERVKNENERQLKKLEMVVKCERDALVPLQKEGVLKDIYFLTKEESDYLEIIQQQQQQHDENEMVRPDIGKQRANSWKDQQQQQQQEQSANEHVSSDDVLCQVCNDGEFEEDNLIVFCAVCNMAVHQKCYLIAYIPQEDWICDVCQVFGCSGQLLRCPLCPKLGGAMKPTRINQQLGLFATTNPEYHQSQMGSLMSNDSFEKLLRETSGKQTYNWRKVADLSIKEDLVNDKYASQPVPKSSQVWVHLSCFLWLPECYVDDKQSLKGIDNVDRKRFLLTCSICNLKKAGAVVQCWKGSCQVGFHAECARREGKFMQVHTTPQCRLEYSIFCDRHVPVRLKRQIDLKANNYETEIATFFKQFDKFRQHQAKLIRKYSMKRMVRNHNSSFPEGDVYDFAAYFADFLEQIVNEKVTIYLQKKCQNQFEIERVVIPLYKQCYELRCVPSLLVNKTDGLKRLVLPFFKGQIQKDDPVWSQIIFKQYNDHQCYQLYSICVQKASYAMHKLVTQKALGQPRMLDLLTRRQKKDAKQEKHHEIVQLQKQGETIIVDENNYCICRQKFMEGQRMIACEVCQEWFHFECIGLKCDFEAAVKIDFCCFICFENVTERRSKKKIKRNYERCFVDPKFLLQKELARECNLYETIKERLDNQRNQCNNTIEDDDIKDDQIKIIDDKNKNNDDNNFESVQLEIEIAVVSDGKQQSPCLSNRSCPSIELSDS